MTRRAARKPLAGRRLAVATPMYEGMCHALYVRGLVELALQCREQGVALSLNLITNQSSVNHARAYIAGRFLRSNATNLMMIDADIGFAAGDVLDLLALQTEESEHDVIGAAYPRKAIDWARIARAARVDEGIALDRVASSLALTLSRGEGEVRLDEPCPVDEIGAGFVMIKRGVLEKLAESHPELSFSPDLGEQEAFGVGSQATAFFETMIDERGAYVSEDFAFCRRVRGAGMQVWLCPWIELTHVGNMGFSGSMPGLAKLAAALQTQ